MGAVGGCFTPDYENVLTDLANEPQLPPGNGRGLSRDGSLQAVPL